MVRSLLVILGLLAGTALDAQDLGRTDRLWREYLAETVRRGLPLIANAPQGAVPFWPHLNRALSEAETLEPSVDTVLLAAWIDRAEGGEGNVEALRSAWPTPRLTRFSPRQWGETLFTFWDAQTAPREWTDSWLGWQDKAYSRVALLRGLEAFEKTDVSAVLPLLDQALQLYPEDRRFLPLVARHPEVVVSAQGILARDRVRGGLSPSSLQHLLNRAPSARDLLIRAGYTEAELTSALTHDYGTWLRSGAEKVPDSGLWTWDSDEDGGIETFLVFQDGLQSWSRRTSTGLWTLAFQSGQPSALIETRSGASWTLRWEAYPWASTLEYRWGDHTMVYRFRPLAQQIPLWPEERFKAPTDRLPSVLADLWLPLDPRALASRAASVETWDGSIKVDTVALYQGQVWYESEDTDRDGVDDTWSYFKAGKLASVYHDAAGRGDVGLRELYRRGELAQVQSRLGQTARNEFVLFPTEGVQLWDPHGTGRPLDRLFVWTGGEKLGALVFTKDALPWETMPAWEPRP